MDSWVFLSRGFGETEGFSHGSLAEFKGNPIQSLAREVCQNSLDAADGSGRPVIVEFQNKFIPLEDFPGMDSMKDVIASCDRFWKEKGDVNTKTFIKHAKKCLSDSSGKINVLRVSDYNTKGVSGAFSNEDITPWGSLVKGNAFSVKYDEQNAAGSYGIGKAAPFVCSNFQTVFYRTLDTEGIKAALGVARLMAHESIVPVQEGEDVVRRAVGYYGLDPSGKPSVEFDSLDALNERTECGTDLFIPGFNASSSDDRWIIEILREIVDNFLYSIYIGKLEIRIESRVLNRENLGAMLKFIDSKDAIKFYEVIRENPDVVETCRDFHGIGTLRLRLLFSSDMNKKVLVVRSSGMKIARISSLPRMISYTGFLELQGTELNSFFRAMENPSHNAWEPKRHGNPTKAKEYKEEVETWVIEKINEKLIEISGEETDINTGDYFSSNIENGDVAEERKLERIVDKSESIKTETYIPQLPTGRKISIRDEGISGSNRREPATEDPSGVSIGHRHRTGKKKGVRPTGRRVSPDPEGIDTANAGIGGEGCEVMVFARIITCGDGINKLILVPEEDISLGQIEIVTRGENGRSMRLKVLEASGGGAEAENGRIVLHNAKANIKQTIEFRLLEKDNFAMGVKAYGN